MHRSKKASLFNHFIGTYHQRQGNFQAECLRGFQVDDELELRRLLGGQASWLVAPEIYPT